MGVDGAVVHELAEVTIPESASEDALFDAMGGPIKADANSVFWCDALSVLRKTPLAGGNSVVLFQSPCRISNLALDDAHVYATYSCAFDENGNGGGYVVRIDKDSGDALTLVDGTGRAANTIQYVDGLVYVEFITNGVLIDAYDASQPLDDTDLPDNIVVSNTQHSIPFLVEGPFIYYRNDAGVLVEDTMGSIENTQLLNLEQLRVQSIQKVDGLLTWLEYDPSVAVYRVRRLEQSGSTTVLIDDRIQIAAFAADENGYAAVSTQNTSIAATVKRLYHWKSPTDEPTVLAEGFQAVSDIAMDSKRVYVTETSASGRFSRLMSIDRP